jgi:2-oxo-4-hydroxy-4-carboxy-5-ureidoimidazoline decarboxylase
MAGSHAINAASPEAAREILSRACGSTRWVDRMLQRRPFGNDARLLSAARIEWFGLTEADWLEAFSHHPKIGDRASLAARFPATHDLSAKEQSGVGGAGADVIAALAEANERYAERFGFIFIVCATGKSAVEMLQLLRDRLTNDRATELRIAAEEQAKITALRLGGY